MTDHDVSMFESGAMVDFILERYGNGRLRPPTGTRARYLQWSWFADTPLRARWATSRSTQSSNPRRANPGRCRCACVPSRYGRARSRRARGRYVVDGAFTAADIMMGYTLILARRFKVLTPDTIRTSCSWPGSGHPIIRKK
jgi:glutathione S-transferase